MAILFPLSGYGNIVENKCRNYLLGTGQFSNKYHGKRCAKLTYINIAPDEENIMNWDQQMDLDRKIEGTNKKLNNHKVRTYNHYIFSPDPKDNVSAEELDEAISEWAERVFQNKFSIVIGYHNDNTNKVQHAHMFINNVNWCKTDKYLRIGSYVTPQCWEYASQLWQYMCKERGWHSFIEKEKEDIERQKNINTANYENEISKISKKTEAKFKIDEEFFKKYRYFNHDINYRRPYTKLTKKESSSKTIKPIFSSEQGRYYTKKALEAKRQGKHLWTDDIRDIIEIAYYQTNNLNDFVNTLDTYDIRVKLTKDKDFLYQHPENKNWVVSGKKLGYDYTRTNLIILFQKQNSNKIKKHSPDNKIYNDLTNKVREIGYAISKQHIGYIDPKTKLTLGDVAKAMRICSYYSVWSIQEIDNKINLAEDKVKEKLFFAKNIINKLESLDDVRKEFEKENPPTKRGKYDIKNISKSQSSKIQKDYLSKSLEKLKSVTVEEEPKTIVKQSHNQPLDSSTKHKHKERRR